MRNKHARRFLMLLGCLTVLIATGSAALAWNIAQPYNGNSPANTQYSIYSGTLYGAHDSYNPPPAGSYGGYSTFSWSQTAVNWIIANKQDNGFQRNKAAIVWHAFLKNSTNCAGLTAANWTSSNLPGARVYIQNHCNYSNGGEEIRVLADSSSGVTTQPYYAQIQYNDLYAFNDGEFDIDTYWLSYYDTPTYRDHMNKICYHAINPNGFQYYYAATGGAC